MINSDNRQTDKQKKNRQTNRQTDGHRWKHNLRWRR